MDAPNHRSRSSLRLLIDGYNVLAPTAPPRIPDRRWLHRERMQLIHRLATHLDATMRAKACVVFDAADPPRDRPHHFVIHEIEVIFAIQYPEADDLLEELIAANSSPKSLAVISSDQRIQMAARRRGCQTFESQPWLDDLLDGKITGLDARMSSDPGSSATIKPDAPDESDVADWMREFGFDED